MRYGDVYCVGLGQFSTVYADFDFETFSEAGYLWEPVEGYWKEKRKRAAARMQGTAAMFPTTEPEWEWVEPTVKLSSLPGIANQKRGLPVVGVRNYVQHPTFELISLSYDLKDGKGPRFWKPGMPAPLDLFEHIQRRLILEAWNVEFEFTVWTYYCVPVLGWPPLDPMQMRCAMSKAAIFSYPRGLDNAGDAMQLVNKKDPAGHALVRKLTVPKNPSKKDPARRWTPQSTPQEFAAFYAYNVRDIIAEAEASSKLPDLSPRELEIWRVDQAINQRGMMTDVIGRENCIAIVEQATEKYGGRLREITGGAVNKHSEVQATLDWMRTQGVYLPNLDEETVEEQLEKQHTDGIHEVLKIRQLLSFGSVKKLYAMRHQTNPDGRLRGQYAYAAAHTHLWNGQGVQVANLYKGKLDKPEKVEAALGVIASRSLEYVEGVYGDALETVADCLRSIACIAAPGTRLIASDYTAIQAVVTAALAGEEWRLEVFRTHGKIYEMCASMITGKPFQFYLDYKKREGKHHEDRQPYGKIPELSAGFGSWVNGWKKFGAGDFMTDEQIKAAILKWRASSPAIVELWGGQTRNKFGRDLNGNRAHEHPELYGLEGAAVAAVLQPGTCYGYRGVRYLVQGDVLYCQPPGDCSPLVYHEPRLQRATRDWSSPWELELSYMGWNSNQTKGQGGWVRMQLYGGILTQNVVAKVSREPQADSLVKCERSGIYLPVMHTHDEIVTEVALGVGSVDDYLKLVEVRREGYYDDAGRPWPIKVPGADETFRYGKWE